jgi:hypothetical protein
MVYGLDESSTTQPKKKLAVVGGLAPETPSAIPGGLAAPLPSSQGQTTAGTADTSKQAPGALAPPVSPLAGGASMSIALPNDSAIPPAPPMPAALPPPAPMTTAAPPAAPAAAPKALSDMTEMEKAQFWAKKFQDAGQVGVVGGGTTGLTGNAQTGAVDPGAAAAHQTALASAPAASALASQVEAAQAADLKARNLASETQNFEQAMTDSNNNIASVKNVGGVYQSPEDESKAHAELMRQSGFTKGNDSGAYAWTGEPENNPSATPGMPANYDPSKPKLANNGSVDASGAYTTPTGPGEYIIGGQVYDNPQGTGTPLRPAPGTPTQNTSPGGSMAAVGGASLPPMTTFDETNNLRDKQINPSTADRGTIAQNYLDAFDTRAEPMLRDKLRGVGQRAAALGRIGMGDTAVEALNPYTDYLKERAALSSELAGRSAEGNISDERSNRGEYRTERDYQESLNRKAIEDAVRQYQLGETSKNNEFGRNATTAGIMMNAGQNAGANAGMDWSAIASLLAPYLNRK